MLANVELSKSAHRRRNFIEQSLRGSRSVLEIGAFDDPIFRREIGDSVKYVDWFSRDELIDMHQANKNRQPEKIVDIDYVVKNNHLSQHIGQKFDLICASHVIEHIADVIRWLGELTSLMTEDGHIFLAIPDKRYTFDYYRNTSTAVDIIRAYDEQLEIPSKWQLIDHFYYHQKVDLPGLWRGERPARFEPRFSLSYAIDLAKKKSSTYTDCHCWVFTAHTFGQILNDLSSAGLCKLVIERSAEPLPGTNEFHVLLRKG